MFRNTVGPWLSFGLFLFGFGLALAAVAIWAGRALTGRRKYVESSMLMITGALLIATPAVLHTTGLVPEYVDANQRLRDLLDVASVTGRDAVDVIPEAAGLVDTLERGDSAWSGTLSLGDPPRYFDARLATLEYGLGAAGRIVVLRT